MPGNADKHAPVLIILCCAHRIHVRELNGMETIIEAINTIHHCPCDHHVHVLAVVDVAVDLLIIVRLPQQPLRKATDSSLRTQALDLWTALQNLPGHEGFILSNRNPTGTTWAMGTSTDNPTLSSRKTCLTRSRLHNLMHMHLQHLPRVERPGEPRPWVRQVVVYNDTERVYHFHHLSR